ncbi:protein-glutamate O-methyltransferase CheR [Sulfurimonas sp.]|uniref:CheR family methyltransferase n=1 Tax=Sulfurimonas sp. TaxID=2022749 RepID=UPI003564E3D5
MSYLLSKEDFLKISEFIYRKSGIYLQEYKYYEELAKYVDARASLLDFKKFKEYFFKLRFEDHDGQEFQELINSLTVNETYFFREKNQFEVLVNKILPKINESLRDPKRIRILSSPCSSGEEPYSIALHIVEKDAVSKKRDIEIIGIDINSAVIQKAKSANYTERSVEAIPKELLSKWFKKKNSYYELNKKLQENVDFRVVNVFDKTQMRELGKFDIIFSRNMFVYFDDASREEVAMRFYNMLNPSGYIFLGDAENMDRIVSVFKAKKIDNTLFYQK